LYARTQNYLTLQPCKHSNFWGFLHQNVKERQMKKIAIYARVSSDNGTQDYQRQINDLKKIILDLGYTEDQIEIFAERISGYKKKAERPELNRMLTLIETDNKYFECIYVTEISRLGRNPSETRQTIDRLTDLNVPIYIKSLNRTTLDKDGKRDTIMNIILQILMEFADAETEQLKTRSKSGLLTSATAGKAGGSKHLPYGYKKAADGMLVVDEDEAVVVKDMFELYTKNNGAKIIRGILNSRGTLTRYNKAYGDQQIKFNIAKDASQIKWSDKTVIDILSNPLYKGQRRFKGEILAAPRIVSDELFDTCEAIRMSKTHRNNLTTYTYLLKDIISCGCCGRNYFGRYKPTYKGDKIYVCSSSIGNLERCSNKGINIMLLETAIFNELIASDSVLKYINETQDIKQQLQNDMARLEHQLTNEQISLPSKEAEKGRLLEFALQGIITSEIFKEKDAKISIQIDNINKRIALIKKELAGKKMLLFRQNEAGTTKRMLMEAATNRTQLQIIFRQLINKVIINDLSPSLTLATIYIQIDGVVLPNTLKIVIDKISIRKKQLRYQPYNSLENEPLFNSNNILLVDKQDVIDEVSNGIENAGWITVPELLMVEPDKAA